MSLVPEKSRTTAGRTLEVTRTYIQRGQSATRSIWAKASPKHPVLRVAMAVPMAMMALTMFILILIVLGLKRKSIVPTQQRF